MARYLVIGGGITGLSAALELAAARHDVEVIERKSLVGGEVLSYCCKATDTCARCGVCVAHRRLGEALRHERVHVRAASRVAASEVGAGRVAVELVQSLPAVDYHLCLECGRCVSACPERCIRRHGRGELAQYSIDHSSCRLHRGDPCTACVDACPGRAITAGAALRRDTVTGAACLVATGHRAFSPASKPRYGWGRVPGVITGREAEELLSRQASLGEGVKSVGFVQCVGSRDPSIGRPWCSAVCCAYAVRLARIIRHRDPSVEVTVYYIDLQSFDKCFTAFRSEVEAAGIRLVRGVPFRADPTTRGGVRIALEAEDREAGCAREHDRLVLSVGLGPAEDSADLGRMLGLSRDGAGFYRSIRDNVLVAGTCSRPQTIPECIGEAGAAAGRMMRAAALEPASA